MRSILIIFLSLVLGVSSSQAQDRYKTTNGEVRINASTPLEDINALNSTTNAILDPSSGNFAVVMLIEEFQFERKLMQEHFNENYMESDQYPKATFSGVLKGFDLDSIGLVQATYQLKGKLIIHGVSRPLETTVGLSRKGKLLKLETDFIVKPEDHGIEVPQLLFQKIAREVQVGASLELHPQ